MAYGNPMRPTDKPDPHQPLTVPDSQDACCHAKPWQVVVFLQLVHVAFWVFVILAVCTPVFERWP